MSNDDHVFEHPSYGLVSLSKVQGSRGNMFGSDVQHGHSITLRVKKAKMRRSLSTTWYEPGEHLVEIHMTETQWGQFVSSFGYGTGTPVTIGHYRDGNLVSPGEPPAIEAETETLRSEFHSTCGKVATKMDDLITQLQKALEGKTVKKGDITEILETARMARQDIGSNLSFVAGRFDERTEEVIGRAKVEMESHWNFILQSFGEDQARVVLESQTSRTPDQIEDGST